MRFLNDISGKAFLYAVPLFLAPFVDKLGALLFGGDWPSFPMVVGCVLLGTVQMCIGLRAFFDGSYERRKSGSDAGDLPMKQQSGNTQFINKSTPVDPAQPTTKPNP